MTLAIRWVVLRLGDLAVLPFLLLFWMVMLLVVGLSALYMWADDLV